MIVAICGVVKYGFHCIVLKKKKKKKTTLVNVKHSQTHMDWFQNMMDVVEIITISFCASSYFSYILNKVEALSEIPQARLLQGQCLMYLQYLMTFYLMKSMELRGKCESLITTTASSSSDQVILEQNIS